MIAILESAVHRLRRALSRSEWWIRLAGLPVSNDPPGARGLVLAHIGGLPLDRFMEAMNHGRMRFLHRLIGREDYLVLRQRQPATAESFQQELFQGVTRAVRDSVAAIGGEPASRPGEPLLSGGSSHTGHLSPLTPLIATAFVLLHADAWLRAAAIAVVAALRRVSGRRRPEPGGAVVARMAGVVLRRELVTAGGRIDAARGLPVIHASFDEYEDAAGNGGDIDWRVQRAMAGLDSALRRIWWAAQRSHRRHYDVWIYSTVSDAAADETGSSVGFCLLPGDAPIALEGRTYVRAFDLRRAALEFLGSSPRPTQRRRPVAWPHALRIMTYNVHSCRGMDGRLSPDRIARMIARHQPDVVALQELDVTRARTGGVDQAHAIASHLEMAFHFHPVIHVEEERYGDAILSRLPMRLVKAGPLPGAPRREPRGALWVAVEVGGSEIQVINTHLGLSAEERRRQVEALLGPEWLARSDCHDPIILCGDFNALPGSDVCRKIRGRLKDAQIAFAERRPRGTFFGRFPMARIDYIFVSEAIEVSNVTIPATRNARVASDHLPLVVELGLEAAPAVRHSSRRG